MSDKGVTQDSEREIVETIKTEMRKQYVEVCCASCKAPIACYPKHYSKMFIIKDWCDKCREKIS